MERMKYNYNNLGPYGPPKCWVGDAQKICYKTREEAEVAARLAEVDYGVQNLQVYKCEFGDHWHLSSRRVNVH